MQSETPRPGPARPACWLCSWAERYIRHRPRVWLTSLELGGLMILLLWIGIAAKHLENRSIDFMAAKRNLHNFSLLFEESVLRSVGEIDKALFYLSRSIEGTKGPVEYEKLVAASHILSNLIVQASIIDENGLMLSSSAGKPDSAIDLSDREHFRFHLDKTTDALFISKPLVGRASGKVSVQLTRRFSKPDGSFGGVVVVSFNPDYFKTLLSRLDLGRGAAYTLFGRDGIVRAVGGQVRAGLSLGTDVSVVVPFANLSHAITAAGSDSMTQFSDGDMVVVRSVAGHPLVVSARIPETTVYKNSRQTLLTLSLVGLALSFLTAIGALGGSEFERQNGLKAEQLESSHQALRESHAKLRALNTDLRQSEADARHQQLLFQSVFESSPDGLVHVDSDRKVVNINPAFARMFGYAPDELRGKSTRCLYASEADFNIVADRGTGGENAILIAPLQCVKQDGTSFPAEIHGVKMVSPSGDNLGYLGVIRDITVQQKRENALREKQRLEALGRLTGGIAHDFNNLLTVISGNLQLIGLNSDPESRRRYLAEAELATIMGARLNQRLMTFARQRQLDPVPVQIDVLMHDLLDLIQRSIGERILVTAALTAGMSKVNVDASEMENAILNLALNARDAMESGGSLSIATSNVSVDAGASPTLDGLKPGRYVRLTVTDSGIGMSDEVASRAFEPFFTTKPEGRGMGLGLTTIHGFIKQSGGTVTLASELGHGTTVTIHLPRLASAGAEVEAGASNGPPAEGCGETILLVEDNPSVRLVTMERMKMLGYQVIETSCGADAIEVAGRGDRIDLVFSDIVMPGGISGFELARRLGQSRPSLKVVLTSGFPDEAARLEGPYSERISVLRKPYSQDQLAHTIAAALNPAASLGNAVAG